MVVLMVVVSCDSAFCCALSCLWCLIVCALAALPLLLLLLLLFSSSSSSPSSCFFFLLLLDALFLRGILSLVAMTWPLVGSACQFQHQAYTLCTSSKGPRFQGFQGSRVPGFRGSVLNALHPCCTSPRNPTSIAIENIVSWQRHLTQPV